MYQEYVNEMACFIFKTYNYSLPLLNFLSTVIISRSLLKEKIIRSIDISSIFYNASSKL